MLFLFAHHPTFPHVPTILSYHIFLY